MSHFPLGRVRLHDGRLRLGKSTLLVEVLYRRLAQILHGARDRAPATTTKHRG